MPHQATITAQTGPARQVTAMVIPAVIDVEFDLAGKKVFITTETSAGDNIKEFDLATVTVVTVTITAGNYAVVIS
jgi:hypothetical protein